MFEFDVKYVPGYEGRYIMYKDGHVYSIGGVSYAELARDYGVDKSTIGRVVCGTSWTRR